MMATRLAGPALRSTALQLRANVASQPAKDPLGPVETVIGISGFAVALLGPMGWILCHLEDYKKKE